MIESEFPRGWDAARVQDVIDHYDHMTEEQLVEADEPIDEEQDGRVSISVPVELLPAIRELLTAHEGG